LQADLAKLNFAGPAELGLPEGANAPPTNFLPF